MRDHSFSWPGLLMASFLISAGLLGACGDSGDDAAAVTGEEDDVKKKKKAGAGGVAGGSGAGGAAGQVAAGAGGSTAGSPGSVCTVVDASGKGLSSADILKNGDPVARLVLQGGDACPKTFAEIQAKLRKVDVDGCPDTAADKEPAGVKTRLVSERSQVLGAPDSYRAVVTRTCGGRKENHLFMSLFGLSAGASSLPGNVELIGFDQATGAFNYYAREEGKWFFFGSSLSAVEDGYDCSKVPGACSLKSESKSRCWGCHTGGGLIMKELNSPWVHWEGDTTTPGAAEFVGKFKNLLGSKDNGISLESTVNDGNRTWNPKRVAFVKEKGKVADLLRPLFCTAEVNVQSSTISTSSPPSSLRTDFFFDPAWSRFDSFSIDAADYKALLESTGQVISDGGAPLKDKSGNVVRDTAFAFSYPERAGADVDYVNKLKDAGIVDDDFIKDVLVIDFTRPIFSKARCDLISFAPEVEASKRDVATLRQGFIDKLTAAKPAAGSPAAQLLANLGKTGDSADHAKKLDTFAAACKARPKKDLLTDAFKVASQRRNLARKLTVFEFPEALPVDNQNVDPALFLDPVTCALTK